jgi:hypothetical protein
LKRELNKYQGYFCKKATQKMRIETTPVFFCKKVTPIRDSHRVGSMRYGQEKMRVANAEATSKFHPFRCLH